MATAALSILHRIQTYTCKWCDTRWRGRLGSLPFTQYCSDCREFLCMSCYEHCEFTESANCDRAFCGQCGKWVDPLDLSGKGIPSTSPLFPKARKVLCDLPMDQCPHRHKTIEKEESVMRKRTRSICEIKKHSSPLSCVISGVSAPSPPQEFEQSILPPPFKTKRKRRDLNQSKAKKVRSRISSFSATTANNRASSDPSASSRISKR